jgi:hypothetical protein
MDSEMNWRVIFVVAAGVLAVLLGFAIVDWDPIKTLCVAVLCLAIACFPSNA